MYDIEAALGLEYDLWLESTGHFTHALNYYIILVAYFIL